MEEGGGHTGLRCLAEQPASEWKSSIMDDETKARINAEIDALVESQLDPTNGSDVVNIGANFPYCDACLSLLDQPVVVPDCTHGKLVCKMCMVRMRVNFESQFCCVDCAAEAGSSDEEAWSRAVVAHLIAAPLNPDDPEEDSRRAHYFKQAIDFAELALESNPDHLMAAKLIQFDSQNMGWVAYYGPAVQRIADQYMRLPDLGPDHPESGQVLYNMLQQLLNEIDEENFQARHQVMDQSWHAMSTKEQKIECFNNLEKHCLDCITTIEASVKYMTFLDKVYDTVNWPKDPPDGSTAVLSKGNLKHTLARENTRRGKLTRELKAIRDTRPTPIRKPGAIKQKPNDKCGCGSGKKHKKCCGKPK